MSEPTLWTVPWSGECIVLALSEEDAIEAAKDGLREDRSAVGLDADYAIPWKGDKAPPGWGYPWQTNEAKALGLPDRTCQQIIDGAKEAEAARPATYSELEAAGQRCLGLEAKP